MPMTPVIVTVVCMFRADWIHLKHKDNAVGERWRPQSGQEKESEKRDKEWREGEVVEGGWEKRGGGGGGGVKWEVAIKKETHKCSCRDLHHANLSLLYSLHASNDGVSMQMLSQPNASTDQRT